MRGKDERDITLRQHFTPFAPGLAHLPELLPHVTRPRRGAEISDEEVVLLLPCLQLLLLDIL